MSIGVGSGAKSTPLALEAYSSWVARTSSRLACYGESARFSLHCTAANDALVTMAYTRLQPCWPSYLPTKMSREFRMQEGMSLMGCSGRVAEDVTRCVQAACCPTGDADLPGIWLEGDSMPIAICSW